MARDGWRVYLASGLAAVLADPLLSIEWRRILWAVAGLSVLGAVLLGIRVHRPRPLLPWAFVATAVGTMMFGVIVVESFAAGSGTMPALGPGDVCFVTAYLLMATGLALLGRGGARGVDRAGVIDGIVIAIAVGLVSWLVVAGHFAANRTLPGPAKATLALYPLLDLLLLALAVRLLLIPGVRTGAHRLLLLALTPMLVADTSYAVQQLDGTYRRGTPWAAVSMLSLLLVGAAALHPTMRHLGDASQNRMLVFSGRRLVLLAVASLTAPLVLAVQWIRDDRLGVPVLAFSSAVLFVLVLVRLMGLVNELRRAQEQRGRLLDRTVQAREEERMRLAAELHDGPIQRLAFLSIDLELARRNLRRQQTDNGIEILESVQGRLTDEIGQLRRVMAMLRPPLLDEVGLTAALRDHVADFERRVGIRCELVTDVHARLDPALETVLYRVAQEALINVGKHAAAAETCRVELSVDGERVELCVSDDGAGFDRSAAPGPERGHYGLVGMRERVEMAGGRCDVVSRPGHGVSVRVTFPGPAPQPPPGATTPAGRAEGL